MFLKLSIVQVSVLLITIIQKIVDACPTECRCRANSQSQYAWRCAVSGWSSLPPGPDASVYFLYMSGKPENLNSIDALRGSDFQNTPNLFSLAVSYSQVKTIESGAFSSLGNLHDLVLSNNEIQSLNAETFTGLSKLRTLDLSGNTNCRFDNSIFTHIGNIEELDLGNMNLRKIQPNMFNSLSKLNVLKLYMNGIKRIRDDFILGLPSLTTLDLNGNFLRGIPAEWKPKFQTMKQVHFSENPLQCNCQLLWLRQLPQKFYASRLDTSSIVCNGPEKVKYASFINVPKEEFICIPPKVVKCEKTTYSVDLNQRIVISCDFEGDPIPEIKWTRPDGHEIDRVETVENQYEIYENGTFVINGVTLIDDGIWKVTAYNKTVEDHMDITVHVIVTTTSTRTSISSSALLTSLHPVNIPSTSRSLDNVESSVLIDRPNFTKQITTLEYVNPTGEQRVRDNARTVMKEAGINWGLLVAAAAGGGTIVGIAFITIICCKKKQSNDRNQVEPFALDDYK